MRSVATTDDIWGREMTLERLEERVVLDGSLDHHMSYAYAPDPGVVACDHHTSYTYAPDPARWPAIITCPTHPLWIPATWPEMTFTTGKFINWMPMRMSGTTAHICGTGQTTIGMRLTTSLTVGFLSGPGTRTCREFTDNAWNYCDWGMYWTGHGHYVLGDYIDWGGGNTDWLFELHDVTTNTCGSRLGAASISDRTMLLTRRTGSFF